MSKRYAIILAGLLLLVTIGAWRWRLGEATPAGAGDANRTPALSASASPAHPAQSSAAVIAMPAMAIARVLQENSQPGRMVFIDFAFSAGQISAVQAVGAAGRVKPAVPRHGLGRLQYDVYSPANILTYSGSIEDPLRERLEYEDENSPGMLHGKIVEHAAGEVALRLPGETAPARVVFYRDPVPTTGAAPASRELVGEVILRSSVP